MTSFTPRTAQAARCSLFRVLEITKRAARPCELCIIWMGHNDHHGLILFLFVHLFISLLFIFLQKNQQQASHQTKVLEKLHLLILATATIFLFPKWMANNRCWD